MSDCLHPRLLAWWKDDPADPDRPLLTNPAVQLLATTIAPGAHGTDLGGVMSLNMKLDPAGLVLRVHQPFVSRHRLLHVQDVRCHLAAQGLRVPVPLAWCATTVFHCGDRWAELESYLPHERLAPTLDSYVWLFGAMGTLHRALAACDLRVPRPVVATYSAPSTLWRWLLDTEAAVAGDPEGADGARLLRTLVRRLRNRWVPATALPRQLVHGDVRLSNVCRAPDGTTVFLDFGFLALRPRIHELAYSLAFMILALHGDQTLENFAWDSLPRLLAAYEDGLHSHLTTVESQALVPYMAAVPLYHAAVNGFTDDPINGLRAKLPFLQLSAWLLAHPAVLEA